MNRWVSVNERFPVPYQDVLVTDMEGNCAVGYYRPDVGAWDSTNFGWLEHDKRDTTYGIGKVVAWMPLPGRADWMCMYQMEKENNNE